MLDQRQRRWADVVQMLYKCFFAMKAKMGMDSKLLLYKITSLVKYIENLMLFCIFFIGLQSLMLSSSKPNDVRRMETCNV